MLRIRVDEEEFFNDKLEEFVYTKAQTVNLEHSLISISKWESFFKKAYFPSASSPGISGYREELYYVQCMIIGNVPDYIPTILVGKHNKEIKNYIDDRHSATRIHRVGDSSKKAPTQTITSEIVYYWMLKFGIPFECEKWHFNRLLTLIDVCNVKENANSNKMSPVDSARHRHQLNKMRRGRL